ncbi:TPA: hypothetical protein ACQ7WR_004483 [Escherichia coli]|jgi:predicted transcriptional regulator|uniref:hypothetical protein n=1 Tax=Enterobacteriaceae TaxID=543 RepID=UPI00079170ED|nr:MULTISPECIES: hypothetical protein [Enterobacteriaceae]EKX4143919.1 hypothetical protein [Enterobacter cloacae]EKS6336963.1 hypothetical protein [Enterobacter hormaechei]MCK2556074.1 hypothetical protein [Escherichia coli]MCV8342352.1 hypothetical protein [Escherichia coli]MCV8393578.1 hypothetical protein [Escherichia coli]
MQIEFSPEVADQLFELARTKKHGSAYAIVRKAVKQYLDSVEAINPVEEDLTHDRSTRSK